ncbi:MAG: LysE family translocator [Puniceicoccales bacterium]
MLHPEIWIPFFLTSLLLALTPGPDNLFVLTQSALFGKVSGFAVVLGLCTGLIGHTLAVAFGIAVIFETSAAAFSALKFAGAGYLLYLAWKTFRSPRIDLETSGQESLGFARLYRRGIFMNLTNPKVSLFFLAFLPQFTDPARGSVPLQVFLLGALCIVATLLIFGAIAWAGGSVAHWFKRSPLGQKWIHRIAGTVLAGLALKLAFVRR